MKSFMTATALVFSLNAFASDDMTLTFKLLADRTSAFRAEHINPTLTKQKALAEQMERSYITRLRVFNEYDITNALQNIKGTKTSFENLTTEVLAVDAEKVIALEATHNNAKLLQNSINGACDSLEKLVATTYQTKNYKDRIRLELGSSPVVYVTGNESDAIDEIVTVAATLLEQCQDTEVAAGQLVKNSKP